LKQQNLMAEIKGSHNGNPLKPDDFAGRSNGAHLIIEIARSLLQLWFLFWFTSDLIALV
jgi:hypothetical protein